MKVHEVSENYVVEGGAEDLRGWLCWWHENVKLYTLFKREDPENDTLSDRTSLF